MKQAKLNIVNQFIDLHTDFNVDVGFESIYNNLLGDMYGTIELIDDELGEYEIEIPGCDTKSGNPIIFSFIDPDKPSAPLTVIHCSN